MTRPLTLSFHGAARTVTGSKYELDTGTGRLLVDCGMFQGERPLRERNWQALPFAAEAIDAVLLTHAHLDHSGMLPVLRRAGYERPVYCTVATARLVEILLTDSGRIHEEDARHANRHGYSRHRPAQPLYTEEEALACLDLLAPIDFDQEFEPLPGVVARFRRGGHILGASWVSLCIGTHRIVFSGDLGRPDDALMKPPAALEPCDTLVLECTYGDRIHDDSPPQAQLLDVIQHTRRRGGMLLIPAFAVGRAQSMLYLLWRLKRAGDMENLPIFLDSPMAIDATEIFRASPDEHRLSANEAQQMCAVATYISSREESRALNDRRGPMVVISASGMMTGGRILHHLRAHAGDPRNTILFTGYQAAGTRGAEILGGADRVRIHGLDYPIRAQVTEITSLSAHADQRELVDWVSPVAGRIGTIYLSHGEHHAATELQQRVAARFRGRIRIPSLGERCGID